jgi:hypothetical protein
MVMTILLRSSGELSRSIAGLRAAGYIAKLEKTFRVR